MTIACLAALLALSACGMNRAVGVLPNTLDDLGRQGQSQSQSQDGEDEREPAP